MAKTHCPQCGSEDTATLRSVYEHGTSRIDGDTVGMDMHGDVTVGGFSGGSSTHAAQRAAPPEKKNGGWPIVILIASVLCILAVLGVGLNPAPTYRTDDPTALQRAGMMAIPIVPLAVVAWLAVRGMNSAARYNAREWVALQKAWSKRWMCRRCGEVWTPGSAAVMPGTKPPTPRAVAAPAGPGRFRIEGVDRATKMDTTWHCTASSEANARAKAELEGIVVTAVERA